MRKLISVTLMAAASLLPFSASAQQGGWQRDGGHGGDHAQRQAPSGNWQRPAAPQAQAPQARAQVQAPQVQAQPAQRPQWNGNRQGGQPGGWQRPDRGDGQRQQWSRPAQTAQPGNYRPSQPQRNGEWQQARPDGNRGQKWQGNRQYNRDPRGYDNGSRYAYGNPGNRGQWNRDWRRDSRYNWSGYRYQNRQAFHLPRYYAPYGWNGGYRRFSVGMMLSSMLFAQDYWIDDPYAYRLPAVDGPYRWVRYYNDALLVDIYSGQVVDVIHDIFW